MQEPLNNRREAKFATISLVATMALLLGLFGSLAVTAFHAHAAGNTRLMLETGLFAVAMFFMSYGNVLYHVCLIGHYKRRESFVPTPRETLDTFYTRDNAPKLSVIIPSYKEERTVNWQTMMSAALSEYPTKNVVLLIDDPYRPKTLEDIVKLEDTRKIAGELQAMFDAPAAIYRDQQAFFQQRAASGHMRIENEMANLAELYDGVAGWLDNVASDFIGEKTLATIPFADRFFVERILHEPAQKHRELASSLRARVGQADLVSLEYVTQQYARLAALFTVNFSSFERKKYANLCHEANKAMNLNAYISVIGKSWKEVEVAPGVWHLCEATAEHADFTIPHADYIDTIDADSLMLSEYVLRLIDMMETKGNEKLAVIQSPCSSFQGAPMGLERTAGATIDVQFRTHQGYTHWGASFWVGANAMLRRSALEEIKETREENGNTIAIYIQDRTVIEDTESTIDLVNKGWKLFNYPERMTFSANPPDFGSLLIQRRRWSNGGLIILPKLFRYVAKSRKNLGLAKELFMRFHYLASTSTGCVAALCIMFYPFSDAASTSFMFWSIVPFSALFIRDLKNTGYKASDLLRICAMNLMLFPIVVGGVFKSFEQILTGKKIPFSRTPKIPGRTAAPALYSFVAVAMPLAFLASSAYHYVHGQETKAYFGLLNVAFATYALVYFVGVKAAFEDMFAGVIARLRQRFYSAEIISIVPTSQSPSPQQSVRQQA